MTVVDPHGDDERGPRHPGRPARRDLRAAGDALRRRLRRPGEHGRGAAWSRPATARCGSSADLRLRRSSATGVPAAVGETVWVAIRPETIELTTARGRRWRNRVRGTVVEHRLPGRPLDLPRPAADGGHGPGQRREPEPPRRAAGRPGRRGLAELAAGRQRRAAVVSAGGPLPPRAAARVTLLARRAADPASPYVLAGRSFFLVPFAIVLKISLSRADDRDPALPAAAGSGSTTRATCRRSSASTSRATSGSSPTTSTCGPTSTRCASPRSRRRWRCWSATRSPTPSPRRRSAGADLLLMLVILPFWTSFLIRVYAWIGMLKDEGLINDCCCGSALIDAPLHDPATPTSRSTSASSTPTCRS